MKRIGKRIAIVVIVATAAWFAPGHLAAKGPPVLIKVAKKVPLIDWAEWASRQADDATRRDSMVIVKAIERGFRPKGQLVSGTTTVDIAVEQTTSFWRGSVKQQVTMPCTATMAFDLDQLLKNSWYNPATNTVEVYLPRLTIIAVEINTSRYTTDPEFTGGCWEYWDSGTARELEVSLLKSDWGALAREKVDPNSDKLQRAAKDETTRFLTGLLRPINPAVKIVVNP